MEISCFIKFEDVDVMHRCAEKVSVKDINGNSHSIFEIDKSICDNLLSILGSVGAMTYVQKLFGDYFQGATIYELDKYFIFDVKSNSEQEVEELVNSAYSVVSNECLDSKFIFYAENWIRDDVHRDAGEHSSINDIKYIYYDLGEGLKEQKIDGNGWNSINNIVMSNFKSYKDILTEQELKLIEDFVQESSKFSILKMKELVSDKTNDISSTEVRTKEISPTIKKTIIVAQSDTVKAGSAIKRAGVGAILLGPVGLLAGMSAKRNQTTTFQVIYTNGSQKTVTVNNDSAEFREYCKYLQ